MAHDLRLLLDARSPNVSAEIDWQTRCLSVFVHVQDEEEKPEREKPELHTDLTTSAAIALYRGIVGTIIRIFVKVHT